MSESKSLTIAQLLFSVLIAGCSEPTPPAASAPTVSPPATSTESAPTKQSAAEVSLKVLDYDGIQQLIASKRGAVVVMDAWSTSCPPCMKEFPNLVALHKKYGNKLACISLSFDYEGIGKPDDVAPQVREFLTTQGATFDNVLSSEESDVLYRKFQLASVPAVFVFDRDGKLVKRFDNEKAQSEEDGFTYEQVAAFVENLLP